MSSNTLTLSKGFTSAFNGTGTENSVSSILGKSTKANKSQDTDDLSGLNKYLATKGYSTVTTEQMVSLAKALNIKGINSVDDVGTNDIGKANKTKIKEAL